MKIDLPLSDQRYFRLAIGDRTLIKDLRGSGGTIPIYSASVQKIYGYAKKSNITDYSHNYVLWGIDWKFLFNIKHKGEQFATTDHCGTIEILDPNIVPEYLVNELEIRKREMGFDRSLRASLTNMSKAIVSISTNQDGTFDTTQQKKLIGKYDFLKKSKKELQDETESLKKTLFEVGYSGAQKTVNVTDIFDFPATNAGITKGFCKKHQGPIPVYASSGSDSSVLGRIQDNLKKVLYYDDSLTWNRNGTVGRFFIRNGRFTTNEDHRVANVKAELKTQLSLKYLKYALEDEVRKLGFGFTHKLGKGKFRAVNVTIPVTSGQYDLSAQEQLADKYERLYAMKDEIVNHLQSLTDAVVQL